jgi:drug/metabolite transporter (DMT)-like permease
MRTDNRTGQSGNLRSSLLSPKLLLTGAALFWSGNFIVGRALRGELDPLPTNFWRWTIALVILLPLGFAAVYRQRALLKREWKLVVALGVTGVAAFHTCVYSALATTPAINALLFLSIIPVAIAVADWLVYREILSLPQALGALVSIGGALVVIARGDVTALLGLRLGSGDLWMLAAVCVWAVYSVLLKRRPAGLSGLALLTATVAAGVVLLFPLYLWEASRGAAVTLTGATLPGLLYVGVFASVLAFLFWNRGVDAIGPTKAGMFSNLMPVFGAILAVVLLGEPIAAYHLVGALLVFGGIAITNWRYMPAARSRAKEPA